MKMMKQMLVVLFTGLLAVLPSMSAWATSNNYWGYATQTVKVGASGGGKVYVNTSNSTNGAVWSTESTISGQTETSSTSAPNSLEVLFYIFAQADSPAKTFDHWSTSADGSDTYKVDGNKVTVISACISAANNDVIPSGKTPTAGTTLYAIFRDSIPVNLTFGAVEGDSGDSYSVKIGNETYTVSSSEFVYNGYESVAVTCTGFPASDARKVVGWYYRDAGGTEQEIGIENAFSRTFTECVTIYPKFVDKVNVVATCKPAENGTYSVQKKGTGTSAVTVEGEDVEVENFDSLTVTFKATPAKGYVFYSWYKKDGEGRVTYFSNQPTVNDCLFNVSAEVGAIFEARKQVAVRFDESVSGSGFTKTCTNSDIDFDTTADGFVGYDTATIALATTVEVDKQPRWWYKVGGSGEKVYFSFARSVTKTFEESVLVGVDFVSGDDSLAALVAEAVGAGETSVTLSSDEAVADGTTVVIPEGFTVVVPAGTTLYVDGTLTVSGTLTVEGTVSKCNKMLVQSGDGLQPLNPYGTVKYWKTAVGTVSASITGWRGTTAMHLTVMRGDGVAVRGAITNNTKLFKCTFDSSVAVNHITALVEASDTAQISDNSSYLLLADTTIAGPTVSESDGKYTRLRNTSTVDCAGKQISLTFSQISSGHHTKVLNASNVNFAPSSYWQQGTGTFYNCPKITVKKLKHVCPFNLYDSGTTSMTFNTYDSTGGAQCSFYSGKFPSSVNLSGSSSPYPSGDNTGCVIYGGGFATRPNDKWIASTLQATHSFYQHDDGYWYLEPKRESWVARIGSTNYDTLEEALAYFESNDTGTITLIRNVTLADMYTLDEGKNLTLELNGCRITAPNGFIENHGTLSIRDNDNRTTSGITAAGKVVVQNEGGTANICYGSYTGNFVVNAGTLTTHNGNFSGSVIRNGGDVELRGGTFTTNVSALLKDGYIRFGNAVGRFPAPVLVKSSVADFAYKLTAMSASDKSLYVNKRSSSLDACASVAEWEYVAELKSIYEALANSPIDMTVKSDRDIAAGSASVVAVVYGLPMNQNIPAVSAGELVRVVSTRVEGSTITYRRFIDDADWSSLEAGIDNNQTDNNGTTLTMALEISKWSPTVANALETNFELVTLSYVIGAGSNVAMLQTPSGAVPNANFFSTLALAVAANTTTGQRIKLCNDCADTVTVGKVCEIDTNGFAFTGEVVAAPGYAVEEANGIYTVTALPVDLAVTAQVAATQTAEAIGLAGGLSAEVAQALVGQAVTYQLTKRDGTGAFVPMGNAADDPSTLTLDLRNGDPSGVYKVNLLVGERVVESENALGVLACAPSAKTVIVAVPWVGADGGDITVAQLFRACDLVDGDQVKCYNPDAQQYEMWTWSATEGWVANNTVATSGTFTSAPAATVRTLARGAAVWLTRSGAAAPFYLCGAFKADAATTAIAAGTAAAPVWNLVAPPTLTSFDLNQIATGVADGDRILVPMGATRREYSFKNGVWGYPKTSTKTIGGETVLTTTRCTTETDIPAGTGFWYISAGGEPTIEWGRP